MGHLKTVIILAGGFLLFEEPMPPKKLAGIVLGMSGIIWYACLIHCLGPHVFVQGIFERPGLKHSMSL